jgi:hypothetical protein
MATKGRNPDASLFNVSFSNSPVHGSQRRHCLGSYSRQHRVRDYQCANSRSAEDLVPYGPMGPDVNDPNQPDQLTKIIHASPEQGLISNLKVVDVATGEVVERPGRGCIGCKAPHDPRPKVDELVTLRPGVPITRVIDIGLRVKWLKDGQYKIRMHLSCCRWWSGQLPKEDGEDGEDERVPARLYKGWSIPLMLETEDEVEVRVKDGKVITSN